MKYYLLLIYSLLFVANLYSQTNDEKQKLSNDILNKDDLYFSGKASNVDEMKAKTDALSNLASNFKQIIQSNIEYFKRDFYNGSSSEFSDNYKKIITTSSNVVLEGVKTITYKKNKREYEVIVYIEKKDYEKSVANAIAEIKDYISKAEDLEKNYEYSSALCNYYTALLKSFFVNSNISYIDKSGEAWINVFPFISDKVNHFLKNSELNIGKLTYDKTYNEISVPIEVKYNGRLFNDLIMTFDDKKSQKELVSNGNVILKLNNSPRKSSENKSIRLFIAPQCLNMQPNLLSLHEVLNLNYILKKEIDFSSTQKIDFKINQINDSIFQFIPELQNIELSLLEWDFGDNSNSSEVKPIHVYFKSGKFNVKLRVNNFDNMVCIHALDSKCKEGNNYIPEEIPQINQTNNKIIISELLKCESAEDALTVLNSYKRKSKLSLGNKIDFIEPSNCYVVVFSKRDKSILAILDKGDFPKTDLKSNIRVNNLDNYNERGEIWFVIF